MTVEIPKTLYAETFFHRLIGLMGKTRWPQAYNGLLFPHCVSVHTFFTFLNPDILFLDHNQKILKIVPSAKAWRVFGGPSGSSHSLEIPSGLSKRLGIKVGDVIQCERF